MPFSPPRRVRHAALARLAPLAIAVVVAACTPAIVPATTATAQRATLEPGEEAAASRVTAASISGPLRFLADDLLEGRLPGTRGGELTTRYIASELEALGVEPGGDDGTYFQKVPLVGVKPELPASLTVEGAKGSLTLAMPSDLVIMAGAATTETTLDASDMVFVGYGIVAPEYRWDDYKDVDVRGKIVVVMNNDPSSDPALFEGVRRLWYGRWDYKYEQATKKGAAAAIVIHTTPSAGYPWNVVTSSFASESFDLPAAPGAPHLAAKMWASDEASKKLAALGGKDLDELRRAAESREFRPVSLGVKMKLAFPSKLRKVESANVIGKLTGADPSRRAEAVVFTAHHDHLGIGPPKNGDAIYNGALDNASGVASLLAIAGAAARSERSKRTMVFIATTGEEQGLLGSEWYTAHPTFAAGRIAANINMDSVNIAGRTSDVSFTGYGKSSLDRTVEAVAAAQGRTVRGDAYPEKGGFYRSDQFNFAKLGVPAIYLRGGPTYIGRPPGYAKELAEQIERERYHQPADEYDGRWDLGGAVEDARLLLIVALRVGNADGLPTWKPGDEFEAARKKAIDAAR